MHWSECIGNCLHLKGIVKILVSRQLDTELFQVSRCAILRSSRTILGCHMLFNQFISELLWAVLNRSLWLWVGQLSFRSHFYCLVEQSLLGLFRLQTEKLRWSSSLEQGTLFEGLWKRWWLLFEFYSVLSGYDATRDFSWGFCKVCCCVTIFNPCSMLGWLSHLSFLSCQETLVEFHSFYCFGVHSFVLALRGTEQSLSFRVCCSLRLLRRSLWWQWHLILVKENWSHYIQGLLTGKKASLTALLRKL